MEPIAIPTEELVRRLSQLVGDLTRELTVSQLQVEVLLREREGVTNSADGPDRQHPGNPAQKGGNRPEPGIREKGPNEDGA